MSSSESKINSVWFLTFKYFDKELASDRVAFYTADVTCMSKQEKHRCNYCTWYLLFSIYFCQLGPQYCTWFLTGIASLEIKTKPCGEKKIVLKLGVQVGLLWKQTLLLKLLTFSKWCCLPWIFKMLHALLMQNRSYTHRCSQIKSLLL